MATKEATTTAKDCAVIQTGGKQYVVFEGDVLNVELLGEHKEGDSITFDSVLLKDQGETTTIGTPTIDKASVKATFLGEVKGQKISILRFKAKSNFDRKVGHRQKYAKVKIEKI